MFERFLTETDLHRLRACFAGLQQHDIASWALTGSAASEIHRIQRGAGGALRSLNDLDFVTIGFDKLPDTLKPDFLFRHVHPLAAPDKILAQFVSPEVALRVDVFRTHSKVMERTSTVALDTCTVRLVSPGDLICHLARLSLPLAHGQGVPAKHVNDFCHLWEMTAIDEAELAWPEHRRAGDPASFAEAAKMVVEAIPQRPDLLFVPQYSQDIAERCPHCVEISGFPLTEPARILSILGYC